MSLVIRSRAPLRVSFAGGGTDVDPYPEMKGGAVISTTIDRYAYVSLKLNTKNEVSVKSQDYGLLETFRDISEMVYDGKLDLVKAAIKIVGIRNPSFDSLLHVDAPPGSGLGSSAAVSASLIGALAVLAGTHLTQYEIAEKAYHIERVELGIKGGRQDQYATVFGGFNFLEFKKSSVEVTPLRIRTPILNELLASILVCDTNITRLSGKILERQSKSYTEGGASVLENLDFIKQSAYDMKNSMVRGNMKEIGELLHLGWLHKKKLTSGITTPQLDAIYDKALESGAMGGKLMGAGGGGHFMFICDPDKREDVSREVTKLGCKIVKINFDREGLQVWKSNNGRIIS
ncbi:MAG: GHMP kinase [Nitrosotalea sp.]